MSLFAPFYFIAFLRSGPDQSAERLIASWVHFLRTESDGGLFDDTNSSKLFLNRPLLLKAHVVKPHGRETWAITVSRGRAPYIAGGILAESGGPPPRFSLLQIRDIINDGLADIIFESREGAQGVISGRAASIYLNAKLDQIGRVKGRFKDEGDESQGNAFRKVLECWERSEPGSEFLSFQSPQDDEAMVTKLLELDRIGFGLCGDNLTAMLESFGVSLRKWQGLTCF